MSTRIPEPTAPASPSNPVRPAQSGQSGRTLVSMGVAYAMGTFNDNFFKQAALMLASAAALTGIQGRATVFFALPFVLFSAWTGWLADRLPKKRLVIWSKALEIAAMAAAFWCLATLNWAGMVAVVFLTGLQSAIFSPALNGSIPELFPSREVPKINAYMKLATTATILLGIALAGIMLELPAPDSLKNLALQSAPGLRADGFSFGRATVGGIALLVAVIGFAASFGIRGTTPPMGEKARFPLLGPVDSARHALECRANDRPLFIVLAGEAFFYTLSSFAILCITNLGIRQLGFSLTQTSLLSVSLMVGICAGSLIAGKHGPDSWRRFMLPAGTAMGCGLLLVVFAPLLLPFSKTAALAYLLPLFTATGVAGGVYLIPLISFIQDRPKLTEKGKVIAISNCASFSGIILSGLALEAAGDYSPSLLLAAAGIVALAFMAWARRGMTRLPDRGADRGADTGSAGATLADKSGSPLCLFLRAILSLRYTVTATGLESIPAKGPILFLPNHPAIIDPVIVYSRLAGIRPRPLSDERQMRGVARIAAKVTNAVLIPDPTKDGAGALKGVRRGMETVVRALKDGDSVLLYPSGRIYRPSDKGRESLGGNSGVASILRAIPDLRVVLVRSTGLWGSSFSYAATGSAPNLVRSLLRGLGAILANGVFFTPRREVRVEFIEAADLPRSADKRVLNTWLEDFYNVAQRPATGVPRFFWQGRKPCPLPEPAPEPDGTAASSGDAAAGSSTALAAAPQEVRDRVYAMLREAAGLDPDFVLTDAMSLGRDLGLDSLATMLTALGLEREFGHSIPRPEELGTVGDCILGALGHLGDSGPKQPAPAAWFERAAVTDLTIAANASSIPHALAALTRSRPGEALLADRSGLTSRFALLTRAMVLARALRTLPGERIGIMLPSVPAAVVVWLAALLAGKVPVFFNWTVGEANLRHCVELSGVSHILSATALLDKLEGQGLATASLPATFLPLEKLAAAIGGKDKLLGIFTALRVRLTGKLGPFVIPEHAAVLFTSGSETLPKAVPLTHGNLLANARDIIAVLRLRTDATVLAMLPPFHSFGLMAGLVLPLAAGLRGAYHPNPTEAGALTGLVRDFGLTLLAAPPTFLAAMLEKARGSRDLDSLRLAFAGAEKCPESVYAAFAAQCPGAALCEGYGVTECSPVVSVNRPGNAVAGTIGQLLPSIDAAVVSEEDGLPVSRAAAGEMGMLLVRGPSIFEGYLGDAPDPFVAFEGQRWYRTGDLVSMDRDGRLTFRGRLKRFIKIGGEMISLPQIETILLDAFSTRPDAPAEGPALAVEAAPEEKGGEIVLFSPMPIDTATANAALRKAGLSPLYSVKRVMHINAIPLLGSGKTDYRALKSLLTTA